MIKYTIHPSTRYIKAEVVNAQNDLYNFVQRKIWDGKPAYDPHNYLKLSSTYIGRAKCHKEDEFSIDFGKKLAKERALSKYYNSRRTNYDKYVDWFLSKGNALQTEKLKQIEYDMRDTRESVYKCPVCGSPINSDMDIVNSMNAISSALGFDDTIEYVCSGCGYENYSSGYPYNLHYIINTAFETPVYEVVDKRANIVFNDDSTITISFKDGSNKKVTNKGCIIKGKILTLIDTNVQYMFFLQ